MTDNRPAIERALREILRTGTAAQRLRASEQLLKVALSGQRLDVAEHREELQHRSREELIAVLADKLSSGSMTGQLVRLRLAESSTIDSTAELLP